MNEWQPISIFIAGTCLIHKFCYRVKDVSRFLWKNAMRIPADEEVKGSKIGKFLRTSLMGGPFLDLYITCSS